MIGRSGERGSGISVLAAWHDDDDIYISCVCVCVCVCVFLLLFVLFPSPFLYFPFHTFAVFFFAVFFHLPFFYFSYLSFSLSILAKPLPASLSHFFYSFLCSICFRSYLPFITLLPSRNLILSVISSFLYLFYFFFLFLLPFFSPFPILYGPLELY